MRQFFKMMFASAFGVFIAIGVLFFISIFTLIGIAGASSSAYVPQSNTVFKISLQGSLMDNTNENPFAALLGDTETNLSLTSLLSAIETAKNHKNISGIYLEAAPSFYAGSADIQALRRALNGFKESGKFIVAYADIYSQNAYYLCSVADNVFLNPQGLIEMMGIASQSMFYKGLMEKTGIRMEVFKVGTYKGAVEPFMLDKLSDANREQINSYIGSIWHNISNEIAKSRNISVEQVNDFADNAYSFAEPEKAVEYGLVNSLKYKKEAEEYVRQLAGQDSGKLKTAKADKINRIKQKAANRANKIAILYAEGQIMVGSAAQLYGSEAYISETVADELARLKDDEEVKAVVFRVNSPGGSAYISEQIWKQVTELKKVKPVVVSMGSLAASGGYYISCAADRIIAEKNTLTGSIGVFATIPNLAGAFDKIGVTTDVVKTNKYSDLGDLSRQFREDERNILQGYVERNYDLFISRCADGRKMSKEEIDKIGQGRVWTGEQAVEIGLVDELGGIETAIEAAAELAGITDYGITKVIGTDDIWNDFINKQIDNLRLSVIHTALGEDYEYVKQLKDIRSASGIQARLPYDIKPL